MKKTHETHHTFQRLICFTISRFGFVANAFNGRVGGGAGDAPLANATVNRSFAKFDADFR